MIIDRIENFLRRHGVISPFTEDDMINASMEDKLREHQSLVERAQSVLHARLVKNEEVRKSIRIATERSDGFADFERTFVRREGKAS